MDISFGGLPFNPLHHSAGEGEVFSANGAGKTAYPHIKNESGGLPWWHRG